MKSPEILYVSDKLVTKNIFKKHPKQEGIFKSATNHIIVAACRSPRRAWIETMWNLNK